MFTDLPQTVQQQVLCFLEVDNFKAAKALHDQYFLNLNEMQDDDFITA